VGEESASPRCRQGYCGAFGRNALTEADIRGSRSTGTVICPRAFNYLVTTGA